MPRRAVHYVGIFYPQAAADVAAASQGKITTTISRVSAADREEMVDIAEAV
jgi:hypothetical protein